MKNIENELSQEMTSLASHQLFNSIHKISDLRCFMENHVFAVLDFMSLTKKIQDYFAPSHGFWTPPQNNDVARFINEVVLAEESDKNFNGENKSHYEMYLSAMEEVGASTETIRVFCEYLKEDDLTSAFSLDKIPAAAREFSLYTYDRVLNWEIHEVVASFCFGREKIIPEMFESIVNNLKLKDCPQFRFYLERHIELDGDEHGPMAIKMLELVCGSDQRKWEEALKAAKESLQMRNKLWDKVLLNLKNQTQPITL